MCIVYSLFCISKFFAAVPGGGVWALMPMRYIFLQQHSRKREHFLLAFSWISGLFSGIALFCQVTDLLFYPVRKALIVCMSQQTQPCVVLLPWLLSAFAVVLSHTMLLFPVCFGKAFLFGFVSLGVRHCFGFSGWLHSFLLLFCDYVGIPMLYLFWIRSLRMNETKNCRIVRSVLLGIVYIGLLIINSGIISPILACLIDYWKG